VNENKTIQMFMSREQNSGQYHNIKMGNKHLECIAKFNRPGTNLTNQNFFYNLVYEDI